jgi:hypothetical protein
MDTLSHFDVTDAAIGLLEKQFQDKEVVLVYENLTHDGGDELPSDVYHLYIFTVENKMLNYYTTSFEKKHLPSDKLVYPEAIGLCLDNTVPNVYIQGIINRVSNYFEMFLEHTQVLFVLGWLEKLLHE